MVGMVTFLNIVLFLESDASRRHLSITFSTAIQDAKGKPLKSDHSLQVYRERCAGRDARGSGGRRVYGEVTVFSRLYQYHHARALVNISRVVV